jgi:hypothetical protein
VGFDARSRHAHAIHHVCFPLVAFPPKTLPAKINAGDHGIASLCDAQPYAAAFSPIGHFLGQVTTFKLMVNLWCTWYFVSGKMVFMIQNKTSVASNKIDVQDATAFAI